MIENNVNFSETELKVLKFWSTNKSFETCLEDSKDKEPFIFYDGPPFATGLPHYGHILSGTIKDTVGRFWHQQGYKVERRFGWDCHGLPVEYEIDKALGITDRRQVLEMGIDKYNDECKAIVMKYSSEWETNVSRMGRWVDFKNGYKTMDKSFMESVWFIFKALFVKDKIYRGYRVMPFSTACMTPISNFEANQNYKEVSDPSVLIAFPLLKEFYGLKVSLVVWTTTPWTLPSNTALLVKKSFKYAVVEDNEKYYIVLATKIGEYFKKGILIKEFLGEELIGVEYSQPFDFFEDLRKSGFFRVYPADFISDDTGTAIVHCAPAFGEEDYNTLVGEGLIKENDEVPCPIDEKGKFTLGKYQGIYFKDLDKIILQDIKDRVLMNARVVHNYPFCWRSDTPLIYRLVPNWFIRVKDSIDDLLKNNELINWIPEDIKYKRFHNWLAQARDWAVSRNRFWGTPIPIWVTEDYSDVICIGSISELEKLSGVKVDDLHRQYIDSIEIKLNGKVYKRIDEVLDCWFESGSMPYAQEHWPFNIETSFSNLKLESNTDTSILGSNGYFNKKGFPAQFIGEGLDQTRGWFYTLHVISTLLFDGPAFENVIVNGIVLADNGRKMSKREKNYPDPNLIFEKYGADSLRLYLISSPVVQANNLKFSEPGVKEISKILLIPWYNSLFFLNQCDKKEQHLDMDDWILASFNNMCYGITSDVKNYKLNTVLTHALKFIDDLSNWYIRINRKQLRDGAALLLKLLKDFSIVMAPFTPFFSEYCYQNLVQPSVFDDSYQHESGVVLKSVHHLMYPVTNQIQHPFEKTRNIIEGVRLMRDRLKLKLKRPLKEVKIVCNNAFKSTVSKYIDCIQTECNILDVVFEDEKNYQFNKVVKPYFDHLKNDPDSMKDKIRLIRGLHSDDIINLSKGPIVLENVEITSKDILQFKEFVGQTNCETFDEFGLIFDVEFNSEVESLYNAREFFSFIQKYRKNLGLVSSDKVYVHVDNMYLLSVVEQYYPEFEFGNHGTMIGETEYLLGTDTVKVMLYK